MNDFFDEFLQRFEQYRTAREVLHCALRYGAHTDGAYRELAVRTAALKQSFIDAVQHYGGQS